MTMLEFNNLNIEHKSELLWEWGYYITNFRSNNKNTVIFSLGNFLAEVSYLLPGNELESIRGISASELPEEHLDKVGSNPFVQMVRRIDMRDHLRRVFDPSGRKDD